MALIAPGECRPGTKGNGTGDECKSDHGAAQGRIRAGLLIGIGLLRSDWLANFLNRTDNPSIFCSVNGRT
jgi:hypothetical protein